MSVWTNDGAVIHASPVTKFNCSVCGDIRLANGALNDWEIRTFIQKHAQEKHGGLKVYRGRP